MPKRFLFLFFSILLSNGCAFNATETTLWEEVDKQPLANTIEQLQKSGQHDILAVIVQAKQLDLADKQSLTLHAEKPSSETDDHLRVTITESQLLDDSVKAIKEQLRLKQENNLWQLEKVLRAYDCYREKRNTFQGNPCP